MVRCSLPLFAVLLTSVCLDQAVAQVPNPYRPSRAYPSGYAAPPRIARAVTHPHPRQGMHGPTVAKGQYPQMGAPLYPTPSQDIPVQVGGTMYTNQAFAPHEMMHEHEYRGLYPPFYYRVRGNWLLTPFGMESHDRWELMGTEVKTKYSSRIPWKALFFPPMNANVFNLGRNRN